MWEWLNRPATKNDWLLGVVVVVIIAFVLTVFLF